MTEEQIQTLDEYYDLMEAEAEEEAAFWGSIDDSPESRFWFFHHQPRIEE